jgi:hypothetical protein
MPALAAAGQNQSAVPSVSQERVADAQHAGLILPGREQVLRFRIVEPQAAHQRKAMRPFLRRLHRIFVVIALPRRRHDDDAVDAGLVHARQEFVVGERPRNVRLPDTVGGPGTIGRVHLPDVDLCVDDDAARGHGGFGRFGRCCQGKARACGGGRRENIAS